MKPVKLREQIWLSDEQYTQLEEIVAHHNEWSAQQEEFKGWPPLTTGEYLLGCMYRLIGEEHAKMLKEKAQQ